MARTPLFRLVRRALVRSQAGEEALAPPALTRRQALAAGAGVLLAGCVTGPAPEDGGRDAPEVLVVGGGAAGLVCAWRLRQAGVRVRLVEAQERLGGRMASLRERFPDGQVAELGGELIDTGHERLRALAAELGLPLEDFTREDPALRELLHFGGVARSTDEAARALGPVAARIQAALGGLEPGEEITAATPRGAQALDRVSLAEWLEGCREADPWIRDLLRLAYEGEFGLPLAEQSALNLVTLLGTDPGVFQVFGESDERFHVQGGNDLVPRELARRMPEAIETGLVLEAVKLGPDGRPVCALRRGQAVLERRAARVVLALPFTLLRRVELELTLPPGQRRAIAELGYGTNAKLMVGFTGRPWREQGWSGAVYTDRAPGQTWETSRLQPGRAGILTRFVGAGDGLALARGTAGERAADLVREIDPLLPGLAAQRGAVEARADWPGQPFSRGSYACYRPGQWTTLRGFEGQPAGPVLFAGEHTSLVAQGYMEGAVESGERAAREVLASLR